MMSSAETAETGSNISFHGDRHSCTENNRFTYLDESLGQSYSLDSPKAVKHNRLDTSNSTTSGLCGRSVRSRTGQRPPRKRQKILPSKPFCLGLYQPNNLQDLKALPREQSVSYGFPTPQLIQGIHAEWPKRGRTNARGRAPILTQYNSPLRSQSYIDSDTMNHRNRNPSRNPPNLSAPASGSGSVSPAKEKQNRSVNPDGGKQSRSVSPDEEKPSRSVSPKKEKQSRSVSPAKGKQSLRDDGMNDIPSDTHEYPPEIIEYLLKLTELPDGFIPLSLKKTIAEAYDADASFHYKDMFGRIDRSQSSKLYYDSSLTDSGTESITRDFDALIHIQEEANYCERHSSDENGWCQGVVVPLLNSALHKPKFSIWKVISVQTQTINPLFATREADDLACEAPDDSADDLAQKKIDYAIFIDSDSKEAHALYKALKQRVPKNSQGLWTHISTANLIPLFILEVKVDDQDAEFQLMTAARAFLKYLQSLLDSSAVASKMKPGQKTSLLKRLPPVIGWVVHRHEWKAYVSYIIGRGEWVWVRLPFADGSTSSRGLAIRLLRIIETLKAHFGQVYMAWLKDVLLSK